MPLPDPPLAEGPTTTRGLLTIQWHSWARATLATAHELTVRSGQCVPGTKRCPICALQEHLDEVIGKPGEAPKPDDKPKRAPRRTEVERLRAILFRVRQSVPALVEQVERQEAE